MSSGGVERALDGGLLVEGHSTLRSMMRCREGKREETPQTFCPLVLSSPAAFPIGTAQQKAREQGLSGDAICRGQPPGAQKGRGEHRGEEQERLACAITVSDSLLK